MAYEVPANRISGPDWLKTVEYDVAAKVPAGSKDDQFRAMWQALLIERFGLHVHKEPKEFAVYELVIGKDGPKLQETHFDTTNIVRGGNVQFDKDNRLVVPGIISRVGQRSDGFDIRVMGNAQSVATLAATLQKQSDRPVLDKTGLTGLYDFTVDYLRDYDGTGLEPSSERRAALQTSAFPDLTTALSKLGLRLVSTKANLGILVVDAAEKVPTEN